MPKDIEDVIEDEILEEQASIKTQSKLPKVEEEKKVEFVSKSEPDVSTSYKDKLVKVYDELESLDTNDIDKQLATIKEQLLLIIKELEESEKRVQNCVANKINEQMLEDKDFHYVVKKNGKVIKYANEPIFTPTNILLFLLLIAIMSLTIVLMAIGL